VHCSTCWPRSSLDRNLPSEMGDRRVGACLPCEVTDSSVRTARDGLSDHHPRSPLHLDDSGCLAVLSTPIRTQWKGPPASRNLTTSSINRLSIAYQPVASDQDQIGCWNFLNCTPLHLAHGRPQVGGQSKRHPQILPRAAQPDPTSTHCRYGPAPARRDHGGGGNRRSRAA
jgi:hypothetical protein